MPVQSNRPPPESAPARSGACWTLEPGQVLSLRPRAHGVLEIARGRVWLTLRGSLALLPGAVADHMLDPGARIAIGPGQHAVLEALNPQRGPLAAALRWDCGAARPGCAPVPPLAAAAHWKRALRGLLQALWPGARTR